MAELQLTPAARDWVRRHGGVLTLRATPRHGCCGGRAALPAAEARAPDAPEDYAVDNIDGVTVYRAQALAEGPYRIDLEGFWRWRRLTVEGDISPWRPTRTPPPNRESTRRTENPDNGDVKC